MTSTRTDTHRAASAEFNPERYTCYGVFDLESDPMKGGEPQRFRIDLVNRLLAEGKRFGAPGYGAGQCGHCGAYLRYTALMVRDDNEMIYVGEQCLEGRFELTKGEFDTLRKTAALNKDRYGKRQRIADLVEQHPFLVWLTYGKHGIFSGIEIPVGCRGWDSQTCYLGGYNEDGTNYVKRSKCPGGHTEFWGGNEFLSDVAYKFMRDGKLSDAQITAVETALPRYFEKIENKQRVMAADAAKVESGDVGRYAAPLGTKKVQVTGTITVADTIDKDSDWGARRMIIVQGTGADEGILVKNVGTSAWMWDAERGQTVTISGTVHPKKGHGEFRGKRQTVFTRTTLVK